GAGSEEEKLKELAKGDPNIEFLGRAPDEVLRGNLQRCKAMIFCAEEDFGLAPVEAQACGCPVIAFGRGGATETVLADKTGVFFEKQETESLKNAIERFENLHEKGSFKDEAIVKHALTFSREQFVKQFTAAVEETRKRVCGSVKPDEDHSFIE
ncbi:MAG TPA: glycosyltransferase family 4 protein, partial [Treponema sp.]|nr:glycosyltransferase family 4 protein [Treponema sp.]